MVAASLVAKDRPRVKLQSGQRLDRWEALVHLRNRFAHSRHIDRETAVALVEEHLAVWRELVASLEPLFEAEVLVASEDGESYRRLDGGEVKPALLSPEQTGQPLLLWRPSSRAWIRLFPLVIPHHEGEGTEALLLEEIKGKQLLYLRGDELIRARSFASWCRCSPRGCLKSGS